MNALRIALMFAALILAAYVSPARADEPTNVIQRYYCIAGDQPLTGNYFLAGHIDISATPIDLWCEPVY